LRARILLSSAALLASSCLILPSSALADDLYTFTLSGTSTGDVLFNGSGTLTATPGQNGAELVTGITGTITTTAPGANSTPDQQTIAAILPLGTNGIGTQSFADTFSFQYDNLLFPDSTVSDGVAGDFDGYGLGFYTDDPATNGDVYYNLATGVDTGNPANPFSESGTLLEAFNGNLPFDQATYVPVSLDFTLTPSSVTPEPSAMLLFGTGLLASAGMLRRRKTA
jgi:hypothetical protein